MKAAKVVGAVFLVVGLLFAIIGSINYILTFTETDERIYTTARIVRIDERKTGDPKFPIEYTTYVEVEVDGEKIIAQLNTYNSSFKTEKQIDIYYFEDDFNVVYQKESEHFLVLFPLVGVIFAILGAVLVFRKNTLSNSDIKIPFD